MAACGAAPFVRSLHDHQCDVQDESKARLNTMVVMSGRQESRTILELQS